VTSTGRDVLLSDAREALGSVIDDREDAREGYRVDAWPLAVKRVRNGSPGIPPIGVALPRSTADVARVLAWAAGRGVAVVPWGGGSSVTGAPLPTPDALVIDMRGLSQVQEIDKSGGRVTVEAGVMGAALERTLAEHGMTTWFSPQSLHRSTVGGWVATRATGQFSSRWGGIEDAVLALTVVLADGTIAHVGTPPRGAVGPDLRSLFIGNEGALGVVTEVVLRIHPLTALMGLEAFELTSIQAGLTGLRAVMQAGLRPALLRLYDSDEARHLAVRQPPPEAVALIGFAGIPAVAEAERQATSEILAGVGARSLGSEAADAWLASRYDFSRIERLLDEPGGYAETIEVAHGWSEILRTYRSMKLALTPLADEVLAHFSHTYTDGTSLYLILLGRAADDSEAVQRLEAIWDVAMHTALTSGAVISHHHGVGRARAPFIADQLGEGTAVLARLKRALDPNCVLHPGSLVPAYRAVING
jgi:alkyldihydroxyacetonephosphate synthase